MQTVRVSLFTLFTGLVVTFGFIPPAYAVNKYSVIMTVESDRRSELSDFAAEQCENMHRAIEWMPKTVATTCLVGGEKLADRLATATDQIHFRYAISLREDLFGNLTLHVKNLAPVDDTDFGDVEWKISADPGGVGEKESQDEILSRLLRRFAGFESHREEFREWALKAVASDSQRVSFTSGNWVDLNTQQKITAKEAYQVFKNESVKQRSFLKALGEIAVVLGMEGTTYYLSPAAQDFDYDWDVAGQMIFKGAKWRFDDNNWFYNQIGHPLTGWLTFGAARTQGFSAMESFLVSFTASSFWEILVEYRERISINDLIMTPVSGSIMGEVLYQFQGAFTRGADNWRNKILGAITNPSDTLARLLYGRKKEQNAAVLDQYGFANDFGRKFELFAEVRRDKGTATTPSGEKEVSGIEIGVKGEINKFENFGQPGEEAGWVSGTPLARLFLQTGLDFDGQKELYWYFQAALKAYRKKKIEQRSGGLRGYEFAIGPAYSSRMDMAALADGRTDRLATVGIVGSTMDLTVYLGKTRVRAVMDLFGDFAAIRSFAYDEFSNEVTGEETESQKKGIPTLMTAEKYFYGPGLSTGSKIVFERGRWELGASNLANMVTSWDGVSRYQDQVTADYHYLEKRRVSELWLSYRTSASTKFAVGMQTRAWDSLIQDLNYRRTGSTSRVYGRISLVF